MLQSSLTFHLTNHTFSDILLYQDSQETKKKKNTHPPPITHRNSTTTFNTDEKGLFTCIRVLKKVKSTKYMVFPFQFTDRALMSLYLFLTFYSKE